LTYDGIRTTFLPMNAPRRAVAGGTTRKPPLEELLAVVGGELVRYLVEIAHRAAIDQAVVLQPERKQHGFLEPLVRDPVAVDFLGDAQAAFVELAENFGGRLRRCCGACRVVARLRFSHASSMICWMACMSAVS
jgi:hypothetical protein